MAQACSGDDEKLASTRRLRVLLLVTGSVAAIKVPDIVDLLLHSGFDVKVAATDAGLFFLQSAAASSGPFKSDEAIVRAALTGVLTDKSEWAAWSNRGDPVLHIELRRWADVVLVAPLDANTLAKLSHGMCDNLVTCVMRAWEVGIKPVVLAPAMNTAMFEHPFTRPQLETLRALYGGNDGSKCCVAGPVVKKLECGDVGTGALAAPTDIVKAVIDVTSHFHLT